MFKNTKSAYWKPDHQETQVCSILKKVKLGGDAIKAKKENILRGKKWMSFSSPRSSLKWRKMDVTLAASPGVSNDTIHKILHGDLGL